MTKGCSRGTGSMRSRDGLDPGSNGFPHRLILWLVRDSLSYRAHGCVSFRVWCFVVLDHPLIADKPNVNSLAKIQSVICVRTFSTTHLIVVRLWHAICDALAPADTHRRWYYGYKDRCCNGNTPWAINCLLNTWYAYWSVNRLGYCIPIPIGPCKSESVYR